MTESRAGRIGRRRAGGFTYPNRTAANGRWRWRRWRTRSFSAPWTPFCLSSGDSRGVDLPATLSDEGEDLSGKVTLQGSNGVEFGMPFCDPTGNVVLGSLVGP